MFRDRGLRFSRNRAWSIRFAGAVALDAVALPAGIGRARKPAGPLVLGGPGGRGRTGFRKEAMLSLVGVGCKEYRERVGGRTVELPAVSCPDPQCQGTRLRGHGWYQRYIDGKQEPLRRVRCPRCRVSHALLPEDLCAYRDATLGAVELALAAGGPSAGAHAAQQGGRQGVRRVRRWLRSAEGHFAASLQRINARCPELSTHSWSSETRSRVTSPSAAAAPRKRRSEQAKVTWSPSWWKSRALARWTASAPRRGWRSQRPGTSSRTAEPTGTCVSSSQSLAKASWSCSSSVALQKLFSPSACERRVDFGKRQDRGCQRFPFRHSRAHTVRARLGDVELEQSAGVEEENQRRSSLTISEASLPRLGKEGPWNAVRSVRRGSATSPRDSRSARRCCSVSSGAGTGGSTRPPAVSQHDDLLTVLGSPPPVAIVATPLRPDKHPGEAVPGARASPRDDDPPNADSGPAVTGRE